MTTFKTTSKIGPQQPGTRWRVQIYQTMRWSCLCYCCSRWKVLINKWRDGLCVSQATAGSKCSRLKSELGCTLGHEAESVMSGWEKTAADNDKVVSWLWFRKLVGWLSAVGGGCSYRGWLGELQLYTWSWRGNLSLSWSWSVISQTFLRDYFLRVSHENRNESAASSK